MEELTLNIKGMMCGGCENRVKNALMEIDGIENVTADHNTGIITITSNKEVSKEIIKNVIEDIGFEVVKED